MGSHKSAPRRGVGEREPLRRRRQVGGKERGRGRKEVSREDATAGGGAGPGIRQKDCSSVWWGRGLQCHSFWGQVRCVPGRALHLYAAPRYHPEFSKGGGKGGGAAESSLKQDANQQSWKKVNKGHAPCRRSVSAHPPLRPSPVHFHSRSASPPPDSRAAPESCCPLPQYAPWLPGLRTQHSPGNVVPRPLKRKKKTNLCNASEPKNRACCPRVQLPRAPSLERGRRAEAVAPGRCLGPDRLHVSPARGHVHRLSPVRHPDVLRINKMKLGETEGQIAPGFPCPGARHSASPPRTPVAPQPLGPAGAREASCSPSAPTRPRPPRRPRGALPQSLVKKVARLTLPKVVACAPLSLPALYSLKHG